MKFVNFEFPLFVIFMFLLIVVLVWVVGRLAGIIRRRRIPVGFTLSLGLKWGDLKRCVTSCFDWWILLSLLCLCKYQPQELFYFHLNLSCWISFLAFNLLNISLEGPARSMSSTHNKRDFFFKGFCVNRHTIFHMSC